MSRYKKHPHGLCLGSDNVFFVIDRTDGHNGEPALILPDGVPEFRDMYRAIVTFQGYSFNQVNTLNVSIKTPAHQLIWDKKIIEWERAYKDWMLPYQKSYDSLKPWVVQWLNDNIGPKYDKWDGYTRGRDNHPCLFFKRRTDALKFVKFVDSMLVGITYTV